MTDDATRPLDDREIRELDELLAALPEKHSALDVAALDGYIAGVLLQPESVPAEAWLPLAFDADGGAVAWPDAAAGQRATDLLMRRYFEMAASIAGREPFDPIVFDLEDDAGAPLAGTAAIVALEPWAAGFATAFEAFPGLLRRVDGDAELAGRVAGILRHLPLPSEADAAERADYAREKADLQAEVPLADLDEAIDDLVGCVLDIADVTRPNRPVARATPKVGRNDPCPCGSGRKYKHCHGRAAE